MNIYQRPEYYEIAFSFRDLRKEVDFFEAAIRKFSAVKVRSVFELGGEPVPIWRNGIGAVTATSDSTPVAR